MYYPCSANKGADQLCGYREADLRLCFCICKSRVFSRRGSYYEPRNEKIVFLHMRKTKIKTQINIDSTFRLLPKFEISSLKPSSVAVQTGLCLTWSEILKIGYLARWLILKKKLTCHLPKYKLLKKGHYIYKLEN